MLLFTYIFGALIVGISTVDKVRRYKQMGKPFKRPYLVVFLHSLFWPLVVLIVILTLIVSRKELDYYD